MKLWRLCQTPFVDTVFDGEGARLFGGRWNPKGLALVYGSSTPSLCVLEVLAHVPQRLLADSPYTLITATIDDEQVKRIDNTILPPNWNSRESLQQTQQFGRELFLTSDSALAYTVPSVLVPEDVNILIDPTHRLFSTCFFINNKQDYHFDERFS